ncbi:MAG: hypothetical protein LBV29_02585 [Azoarcus sp.]|jgi:hypothetical protein|nr:hypothetical protein [Azoarcus sp.]
MGVGELERVMRNNDASENPLFSLVFWVKELRCYPPPEILVAIAQCIENYRENGGDISLDEAFFGKPHKKRTSPDFESESHYSLYAVFHRFRHWPSKPFLGVDTSQTLEAQAEGFLAHIEAKRASQGAIERVVPDIDTFLRGYRRWVAAQHGGADKN